jgi:hypothetical protein
MYKILSTLLLVASLNANVVGGVSIVVKGEPITIYEIKKEMRLSKIGAKEASELLIRRALENAEVKERYIEVSSSEVYDDIFQTAKRNNMNVNDFYKAVQASNGLTSSELKQKIKLKLLSQKLYRAISYSSLTPPNEDEIKEYYELHKKDFLHPSSFNVTIYKSQDQMRLQQKIQNMMFYAPDIVTQDQSLPYSRISPQLAKILEETKPNSFTQIIPDAKGIFMSFYLKEIVMPKDVTLQGVKEQIINTIMAKKREAVLGDYFARLRHNAEITVIREVE